LNTLEQHNTGSLMNDIEKAISIAVQAHSGQKDKAGMPYVLHPIRLMLRQDSPEAMVVAVLHDVVEDTDITFDQLAEAGFSVAVLEAISLLTHDKNIPYMDYIKGIAGNAIARQVKLADLIDNIDLSRIPNPQEKDHLRIQKYQVAYDYLMHDNGSGKQGRTAVCPT